jgi:hypothetical protein
MRSLLAILLLGLAVGAAEVRLQDDFAGYREGSPAAKGWETDAVAWQVRAGRFASDWLGQAEAFPLDRRIFRTATVEVTVIPRKATGKDWKIAGVGLKTDPRNFWHLAFVEAPASNDKAHHVELTEMREGKWLSQSNLKVVASQGTNLPWTYGTPYRLRLALTAQGIDGKVLDMSGHVLAHLAYAFSAPAVKEGRPCLRTSRLAADFDDFLFVGDGDTARVPPPPEEKTFPAYAVKGSGVAAPIAANGFFQVVKKGDRWWLVDPRGELFYAVGTDHVNYYSHWCQKLGYAPYHKNAEKRYGSVQKWADSATARLRQWGFNLLGAGNIAEVRYKGLAHTLFVAFGSTFSSASALVEKTHWTGFPNVFDPRWEAYCDKMARRACSENRKDPWLLGYFLDNELEWYGKTHRQEGIWTDTMKWPADHTGKLALLAFVRKAHGGDLQQFNRVWEQKAASWDDLPKLSALPAVSDRAKEIQLDFLAEVADRYFHYTTAAIRKVDPNHLIIGSRFAGNAPEWAWKACARYCDVVTFNNYPRVDMATEDLSPIANVFTDYYDMVQKPMMITEWSFPALDAGLPSKHGAGMRVDTQEQKTHCVEMMQHLNFRLPFMVGSDYFMWADEPKEGISDTFPEDSNYGLNNVDDKPYKLLTSMFAKLNPMAIKLHAGEVPEGYIEKLTVAEGAICLIVRNAGATVADFPFEVREDGKLVANWTVPISPNSKSLFVYSTGATPPLDKLESLVGRVDSVSSRGVSHELLKPGIHVLEATLTRGQGWLPRGCRGRIKMTACVLMPGPGVSAEGAMALRNPTAQDLSPACTVLFPPKQTGADNALHSLVFSNGTDAPARWLGPGALATQLPALDAGQALVARLGNVARAYEAVEYEELPEGGFRIDNGVIRLENDGTSGNVIDRFQVGDLMLGSYNPLIWQEPKDNQWTRTNAFVKAEAQEGPVLLVDVTCEYQGGEAITAVDEAGKMPDPAGEPVRFQITHRFAVWPNCPYIAARLVRIKNLEDKRPLKVNGYFLYLPSAIGGDADDDEPRNNTADVPNYYRRSAGTEWYDEKTQARYGVVPLGEGLSTRFWRDPGGGPHPDAYVKLKPALEIAPGHVYVAPDDAPVGLIYGARDEDWPQVEERLNAATHAELVTP